MTARTETIDLGFRPRPWQSEAFRRRRRFNVRVVHRRAGKTVMAVMRLIDDALRCTKVNPRYGYIAPLLKQAKAIAWEYLKQYAAKVPGTKINESELYVEFPNGARVRIFGGDNPDSLRGLYFDGVVLDEVADLKPEVWTTIILPALLDRTGWADFIGTPKGVNLFSEIYYRAVKEQQANPNGEWSAMLYGWRDTDALPAEEIERAKATMPEALFRQELECDFTAAAVNALIPIDVVNEAAGRHLRQDVYDFAPIILGVDVARQGDDRSVIYRRQGLASWAPLVMQLADSMAVADAVAQQIALHGPDAVFVDGTGGYGAGVIDRLRQMGYDPIEVQFGGKPGDPRFANKRAEMYWGLADWLRAGGAIPDRPSLKTELTAPTYSHDNARGVLQLESKEDIKSRLGFSPDEADALALTFAFPVAKRSLFDRPPGQRGASDYDSEARWLGQGV